MPHKITNLPPSHPSRTIANEGIIRTPLLHHPQTNHEELQTIPDTPFCPNPNRRNINQMPTMTACHTLILNLNHQNPSLTTYEWLWAQNTHRATKSYGKGVKQLEGPRPSFRHQAPCCRYFLPSSYAKFPNHLALFPKDVLKPNSITTTFASCEIDRSSRGSRAVESRVWSERESESPCYLNGW